jgi:hypothetical protein
VAGTGCALVGFVDEIIETISFNMRGKLPVATQNENRGGSHEQHVKAGEQSHKNTPSQGGSHDKKSDHETSSGKGTQGGTHEQHVKAGQQSHKNS